MSSAMDTESIVTVASDSGVSESLPVSLTTMTVKELSEWCSALLGLQGDVQLFKDGRALDPAMKLEQAGVRHGDLLAAQQQANASNNNNIAAVPPPPPAAVGGLDFSNLLAGASAASAGGGGGAAGQGGGLDFSSLLGQGAAMMGSSNTEPIYYSGMTLNEAWDNNPKPEHIIKLLQAEERLFKELNYHQPMLANKIRNQPYEKAVQIWREEIIKGGIQQAMARTNTFHKENEMKRRLQENSNDEEVSSFLLA